MNCAANESIKLIQINFLLDDGLIPEIEYNHPVLYRPNNWVVVLQQNRLAMPTMHNYPYIN